MDIVRSGSRNSPPNTEKVENGVIDHARPFSPLYYLIFWNNIYHH